MPASLELNLDPPNSATRSAELAKTAEHADQIRHTKGHRAANQALLDVVGLVFRSERDDEFYRSGLDFHLNLVYNHAFSLVYLCEYWHVQRPWRSLDFQRPIDVCQFLCNHGMKRLEP